jgi:protein-arginine kinase
MDLVMSSLGAHLDFCMDAQLGHLTSCPTNVGSAMRVSYMVDMRGDASQQPQLKRLEVAGAIQIRGAAGEYSPPGDGLVDVGLRNRVGISAEHMLQDMEMLVTRT